MVAVARWRRDGSDKITRRSTRNIVVDNYAAAVILRIALILYFYAAFSIDGRIRMKLKWCMYTP